MSENDFVVESHAGPYPVAFRADALSNLADELLDNKVFLVDSNVAGLYEKQLGRVLRNGRTVVIEASEPAKSLDAMPVHIEALVAQGVRRGDLLVAIGGGVIQDIACFIAATLFRGLTWTYLPTTLLAQADSCIGSKSSINVGRTKNLVGTFTPPESVVIDSSLLGTLDPVEIRSGIGEMLKVHAIKGPGAFDQIASAYDSLLSDEDSMRGFIRDSLLIKKAIIEEDEFDQGPRNVMNYGHSFGHAIEASTDYAVPHGIAVTIGMDMANSVACELGLSSEAVRDRMSPTLLENAGEYSRVAVDPNAIIEAIGRDKKNTGSELRLILPDEQGLVSRVGVPADERFSAAVHGYLERLQGE